METLLVAYDISDSERMRTVASTCGDFGYRSQSPVFVCRLTATDLTQWKARLYEVIDLTLDQVIIAPLYGCCSE